MHQQASFTMDTDKKQGIITFKAGQSLLNAMRGIPNRSEFIRTAILSALDSTCPLCRGTGILTPDQRRHWQAFSQQHGVTECEKCHATHLVCTVSETGSKPDTD